MNRRGEASPVLHGAGAGESLHGGNVPDRQPLETEDAPLTKPAAEPRVHPLLTKDHAHARSLQPAAEPLEPGALHASHHLTAGEGGPWILAVSLGRPSEPELLRHRGRLAVATSVRVCVQRVSF